jgi:hypothetical protein
MHASVETLRGGKSEGKACKEHTACEGIAFEEQSRPTLFDMFATAACRTTDSLGSPNRYNYGIKNEWRFLNVVPLFDMFATAAYRTTDSLGSPNR